MTNTNWPNHLSITNSKRDPKPRTEGSWWLGLDRTDLNTKARELFPNATAGETFSGIGYLAAEKHGLVG